eukprot:419692_1
MACNIDEEWVNEFGFAKPTASEFYEEAIGNRNAKKIDELTYEFGENHKFKGITIEFEENPNKGVGDEWLAIVKRYQCGNCEQRFWTSSSKSNHQQKYHRK